MNHQEDTYEAFADFYATGEYPRYSESMADRFQDTLNLFDAGGERVLDVACGEGSFVTSIADEFDATGIDVSERMIQFAREQAADSPGNPEFHVMDARNLDLSGTFDVVTCWFDSINHLLDENDVAAVFRQVYACLRDGGTFVFDVNTIRRLAEYDFDGSTVVRDERDRFETYTDVEFDYETDVLTLTITGFERCDGHWERFDEVHRERGYPLDQIERMLREAGFEDVVVTESLEEITEPDGASRVYFSARKVE